MPESQTTFEDLPILSELRDALSDAYTAHETAVAPSRSRRQRRRVPRARVGTARPVLLTGACLGIAGAVIAAAVLLLAGPATQPAYALTENPDGSITVTIRDIATAVPALNARFAALGIEETVVPVQADCPTTSGPASMLFADPEASVNDTFTLQPGGKWLAPGFTGVLAAEQLPSGEVAIAVGAVKPPVPSCFPTTAYTMKPTGTSKNGVPIYQEIPVNPATGASETR